ncbi:MAG: asparagine synthase (glutamine-hydrolyzing) [Bacteroidetes bacterium HGW-Bacteroidetes-21]|nr:MAG: asparagine synthase (glutamine-hydrolyzing) [Bacteroidetes bacterium HGW-Bacteroidetes-21]
MCGIFGVYNIVNQQPIDQERVEKATFTLKQRGPDGSAVFLHGACALGHTRLSVIDVRAIASQPMTDESGRYTIVFNGECYNYRVLKAGLQKDGISFFSDSDTEVILKMYIRFGEKALNHLNGCFAFAVYDNVQETLFIARDRLGIKPLLYYYDEKSLVFASELRAIMEWGIPREPEPLSFPFYFQLNYIPAPLTILKNVLKLMPGQYLKISKSKLEKHTWWVIPENTQEEISEKEAQEKIRELLYASVERRLIADVPLGCFLSGGIDSAIITGIAREIKPDLQTFSIGFPGMGIYDESSAAETTAKKHNTKHTTIPISTSDLLNNVQHFLEVTDEPFADSSAVAVNILSQVTKRHMTVALSGDGADELFGGYNKHAAHLRVLQPEFSDHFLPLTSPLGSLFSGSRSSRIGNLLRKASKFQQGRKLSHQDRYWLWCSLMSEKQSGALLKTNSSKVDYDYYRKLYTGSVGGRDMNEILTSDLRLVLANDMLTKADKFSMSEGLEIRVPFLDHTLVEYVNRIKSEFKINKLERKSILRRTFTDIIPDDIMRKPKHGFEIPVEKWMKNELRGLLDEYTQPSYIERQGVFNINVIQALKKKSLATMSGDTPANLWAILVFQYWWKKYLD